MRQAARWTGLVFLAVILASACSPAWCAPPDASQATAGYLENVTFEKLPGKERVILTVSKQSGVTVENQPGSAIAVRLENLFVPEELRRPLSDAGLINVLRVTPAQKTAQGRSWALATVEMKQKVPYSVRQEGLSVLIDFNITSLPSPPLTEVAASPAPVQTASSPQKVPAAQPVTTASTKTVDTVKPAVVQDGREAKVYKGSRIFLDVQDADIKAVFRLLSEQGKVSIVSGDDVKGTVTVHMKDVPWDQALDTILNIKGLAKRQEDNIITIVTLERQKKDEADRVGVEEAKRKAEDDRKARELKLNAEQGSLRQIAIEAKIVEVTAGFSRELGIQWGAGYAGSWGGGDVGGLIGTGAAGALTTLPRGIGLTSSNTAVNFPAVASIATPGIGLVYGASQFVLAAKLSALESNGNGKIISTPKVMTMDGIKATIEQGEEIPYKTVSNSGTDTKFKDAVLKLSVTPKITAEGKISMEIEATNNYADRTKVTALNPEPPIAKNRVESKVLVETGDTVVVGGVFKSNETNAVTGIPFLSEIPLLGWLFKYETKEQVTREVLFFITPRIIQEKNARTI